MRPLIVFLAALAIIGCSTSPTEPGAASASLKIRFGETTVIGSTPVTFADITDSRCPTTVTCVWAGDAAVRLDSGSESLTLHTNSSAGASSGKLGPFTIALTDVAPVPVTAEGVKKSEYVITIRVSQ